MGLAENKLVWLSKELRVDVAEDELVWLSKELRVDVAEDELVWLSKELAFELAEDNLDTESVAVELLDTRFDNVCNELSENVSTEVLDAEDVPEEVADEVLLILDVILSNTEFEIDADVVELGERRVDCDNDASGLCV